MDRNNRRRTFGLAALVLCAVNAERSQADPPVAEQKTVSQVSQPPPERVTVPQMKKADLDNLVRKSDLAEYATKAELDEIRARLERLRERLARLRGGVAAVTPAPATTMRP